MPDAAAAVRLASAAAEDHGHIAEAAVARLIIAWLVVGVPLAYGVIQTVLLSLKLFG